MRDLYVPACCLETAREWREALDESKAREKAVARRALHAEAALARVEALADKWEAEGRKGGRGSQYVITAFCDLRAALKSPTNVQDSSALTLDGDGDE